VLVELIRLADSAQEWLDKAHASFDSKEACFLHLIIIIFFYFQSFVVYGLFVCLLSVVVVLANFFFFFSSFLLRFVSLDSSPQ
jgi:hypothetical protein